MSQSPLSGSRAILVLGMHRSGTSALTGTLAKLGVAVGDDAEHLAPRPDNPKGFWENADVFRIHEWLLAQLDVGWDDIRPMPKDWLAHSAVAEAKDQLRLLLESSMAERALWAVKDPRLCRLLPMWRELLKPTVSSTWRSGSKPSGRRNTRSIARPTSAMASAASGRASSQDPVVQITDSAT